MAETFRAARWQRAGATRKQLTDLLTAWDEMTVDEQTAEAGRVDSVSDDDLAAELASGESDPTAGNVDEVLARVGDDPEAAAIALSHEQAKPRPRKGLIDGLEAVIAAAAAAGDA